MFFIRSLLWKSMFCGVFLLILMRFSLPALSQAVQQPVMQQNSIEGWLNNVHFDPMPGSGGQYRVYTVLTDVQGNMTLLNMPSAQAQAYHTKYVRVFGQSYMDAAATEQGFYQAFSPSSIIEIQIDQAQFGLPDDPIASGDQPFVNILCRFSDSEGEPFVPASYFDNLLGSTMPQGGDYWNKVSGGRINVYGMTTTTEWQTLPNPFDFYNFGSLNSFVGLAKDCLTQADDEVDFSGFAGINMIFDQEWGFALGGAHPLTLDGVTKSWRMTFLPPFAATNIGVVMHEMGHAFSLHHSSGNYYAGGFPYDSRWDVMSSAGQNDIYYDPTYGYVGPGTISYSLDSLGWIPPEQKITVETGTYQTITLQRLHQPTSPTTPLMVKIPINGSTTEFYTVELRTPVDYDYVTPAYNYENNSLEPAVVIHYVNTEFEPPAYVIQKDDDLEVNDDGGKWQDYEIFSNTAYGIMVGIISVNESNAEIIVVNGTAIEAFAPLAPTGRLTLAPFHPAYRWVHSDGSTLYAPLGSYYHLIVEKDDEIIFDEWFPEEEICSSIYCEIQPEEGLYEAGIYDWSVEVWYETSESFGNTISSSFEVVDIVPGTPIVSRIDTYYGTPIVYWRNSPAASWYQIRIRERDTETVIYEQWIPFTTADCTFYSCYHIPDAAISNGNYEVEMRSWGPGGFGKDPYGDEWTTPVKFNLERDAPTDITEMTANYVDSGRPSLYWRPASQAAWYHVWIGTLEPEITTIHDEWYSFYDVDCYLYYCSLTPNVVLEEDEHYDWYIQAWGSGGFSEWAEGDSFTVNPVGVPPAPQPLTPTGIITTTAPLFQWSHSEDNAWYRLEVRRQSTVVYDEWHPYDDLNCYTSGTICRLILPDVYLKDGDYTWRLQAYNPAGVSGTSGPQAFSVRRR